MENGDGGVSALIAFLLVFLHPIQFGDDDADNECNAHSDTDFSDLVRIVPVDVANGYGWEHTHTDFFGVLFETPGLPFCNHYPFF